jgi:hypothetical protein
MDDKGTYIKHDNNGHINVKKQLYKASPERKTDQNRTSRDLSPGPGAYETNISLVGKNFSKTSNVKLNLSPSI